MWDKLVLRWSNRTLLNFAHFVRWMINIGSLGTEQWAFSDGHFPRYISPPLLEMLTASIFFGKWVCRIDAAALQRRPRSTRDRRVATTLLRFRITKVNCFARQNVHWSMHACGQRSQNSSFWSFNWNTINLYSYIWYIFLLINTFT